MRLRVNDLEISYQEAGSGEAVLLVHAFPLSRALWAPQLKALPPRYRALAPDLRGFGESRLPVGSAPTIETYADDLAALLREKKIPRAVLVGCSMGGYIAFAFLRRHRPLLRALVLADTRAAPDTAEGREGRLKLAAEFSQGRGAAALDGLLKRQLGRRTQAERPGVVSAVRRMMEEAPPEGVAAALHAMAQRPDSTPLLGAIDLPTLVLVGEEDEISPPAEARAIAAAIPGAQLEIIPGAGHLSGLENPEPFNRALLGFLDRL